jgi:NAD(P)-dependent dehydrogenase (short-subunit alcohol dehydrogenase family)
LALLPLDFIPIETSHGMSVITALVLAGFGATVYYTTRWLNSRIADVEKMTAKHNVNMASVQQSNTAIAKSLDITRETMREDLQNAVDRIEDRFAQIQNMIRDR